MRLNFLRGKGDRERKKEAAVARRLHPLSPGGGRPSE